MAEWPVILQSWRVDWREREGEAGSPGLTRSSHDHFDRKEYSWCCTKKYIDNVKLIQEGNAILQNGVLCVSKGMGTQSRLSVYSSASGDRDSAHWWGLDLTI